MKIISTLVMVFSFSIGFTGSAYAATIFSDNFDTGASPLWGNENGSWVANAGVYDATAPNNFPSAYSSLPFNLTDFSIEFDINNVVDGGVWLRSTAAPGTVVGRTGILLVTAGFANAGLYWHIVTDGSTYEPKYNADYDLFIKGVDDPHIRVDVSGNTYSAFVNGSITPATTLVTSAFTSGQVALYDYSGQTFDNVLISTSAVPIPAAFWLFGSGLVGLIGAARRKKAQKN